MAVAVPGAPGPEKLELSAGTASHGLARSAQPMRWVKLTLPAVPVRASWLFRISRLTSRSLAGTTRKLVAVGTSRLEVMLETTRAALPRRGTVVPSTPAGRRRRLRLPGFGGRGRRGRGLAAAAGAWGAQSMSSSRDLPPCRWPTPPPSTAATSSAGSGAVARQDGASARLAPPGL